ncbi:MAG: 16S rRNA (cytosine(967)-C(5))-methyltransferase RsmB [Sedimentisphaerales bacterium]|nr:16S rRNA (cytosine(967)-C(5))-methyltransferase RsmB [Sedimentisphaerales bacterium]
MAAKRVLSLSIRTARDVAVHVLMAFEREDRGIQAQLDEQFNRSNWSRADKGLIAEIALGVCRHALTLDMIISNFSSRDIKRIEPLIRQILRVGLYQLIYLDGVADYAAVSEAVDQAQRCAGRGAGGFVNALLRATLNHIESKRPLSETLNPRRTLDIDGERGMVFKCDLLANPGKQPARFYSMRYGLPIWLIERWLKQWSVDIVHGLCQAANRRPLLTLRINYLRCQPDLLSQKFQQADIDFTINNNAIFVLQPIDPRRLPGYDDGLFSVQDFTAQQVAPRLGVKPGMRVLDLCAAPGGKTTHLAELMNNQGTIIACDVHPDKLARIKENAQRLGLTIIQVCHVDELSRIIEENGLFDAVLADVPCSNTGVLARRVEVRHRLKPSGLKELARQQTALLETARNALRPGGKLFYSTCSIESVENTRQVERYRTHHPEDTLISEELILPGVLIYKDTPRCNLSHDGGFTALIQRR